MNVLRIQIWQLWNGVREKLDKEIPKFAFQPGWVTDPVPIIWKVLNDEQRLKVAQLVVKYELDELKMQQEFYQEISRIIGK